MRRSPAEPVSELRRIPIRDNGEPLVDYLALCGRRLLMADARFQYRRVSFVRESVGEMLCRAAAALPSGYRLAVIEGWRPPYIQRRMYQATWARFQARHPDWSDVQLRRVVNRYTAPLDGRVPPPHSTGGAVDLLLTDADGHEQAHSAPYEPFDPRAFAFDAKGLAPASREVRRILADALHSAGLTNYPSEWWHWTYGDQGWAYRTGQEFALFGRTEPSGWEPYLPDDTDAPLQRAVSS